jgi:hypothetical protein
MLGLTARLIVAIGDGQRIAADPVADFELGFEVAQQPQAAQRIYALCELLDIRPHNL